MKHLNEIPAALWSKLGALCASTGRELQSDVISSASASVCFFSWRVLAETEELPWRLALGDKVANMRDLVLQAQPGEPVAASIWHLLQAGFPIEQLEEGLCFVAGATWSSRGVEQGHEVPP
jgi:hypothetical protein